MKKEVLKHLEKAAYYAGTEEVATQISKLINEVNMKETEKEWVDFETGVCECQINAHRCTAKRYSESRWECKIENYWNSQWTRVVEASCFESLRDVEKFFLNYIELIG